MKIATFNINGINGRFPVLERWLKEQQPDIVCLQELKAPTNKFPERALSTLGYNAVWHGQKMWNGVAILARGMDVQEVRNKLPGDLDDDHSRYIEAIVDRMLIGCLYLPNGNPAPGPKFDYKLSWFKRLKKHAKYLLSEQVPVVLAGDYNVIPTEVDVYNPERWANNALYFPQARKAYKELILNLGIEFLTLQILFNIMKLIQPAICYTFTIDFNPVRKISPAERKDLGLDA
jgi:exodeoxyribonuclease III